MGDLWDIPYTNKTGSGDGVRLLLKGNLMGWIFKKIGQGKEV